MNILLLRLSSLGDIILTQPICAILQKIYPDCHIDFLCKEEYKELPEMFAPPVNTLVYQKTLKFHLWLSKRKYDVVLDLHSKFATFLLMLFLRAPQKVRYHKQRRERKRIVKGDKKIRIESTVALYASALTKLGINEPWSYPRLQVADILSKELLNSPAAKQENTFANPIQIAIFPGANHFTKRYPAANWIQLINSNPQYNFILFGSKTDEEQCALIAQKCLSNCRNKCSALSLPELVTELNSCAIIISGDTGPMHLGASLQKPQIAIFGGTHPRLGFKPLNKKAIILCAELSCQPCSLHGREKCPLQHFNCMNAINPALLDSALKKALKSL
ncbi:MAG TPA: glycosyltransferase family 9 protein [Candidatus Cloacimonas sp.]|nr:glycosyltransferase family 9 protein [Candidatus Cloacimonas sp.]HQO17766.1 glycosyltransferase family 9 protein [Candidatus Cloacimonas sp.]